MMQVRRQVVVSILNLKPVYPGANFNFNFNAQCELLGKIVSAVRREPIKPSPTRFLDRPLRSRTLEEIDKSLTPGQRDFAEKLENSGVDDAAASFGAKFN